MICMMKLFFKIHLWLSVPFGIVITLICFSGAMLAFEPEMTRALRSDVYYVTSSEGEPIDMGDIMETVKATLPDSVSITGVTVFADRDRTYQINLSKPQRASLFVDQYSGKITGKYERIGFFTTMFRLHRWLLDSADPRGDGVKTGKLVVGISTLIFVIVLLTGMIVWLPRARKKFVHSLSISMRDGWNGLWRGLHVAGGMYALVLLLAMSLTGLTWSFNWYRTAFYSLCGVVEAREQRHGDSRNGGDRASVMLHGEDLRCSVFRQWQHVYDELKMQNPYAPQITVGVGTAVVGLGSSGNVRASDRYEFNSRSGEISLKSGYAGAASSERLRGWIYSIHTGNFGGLLPRILWFLGALLGASLPLTGYYIWIRLLYTRKCNVLRR